MIREFIRNLIGAIALFAAGYGSLLLIAGYGF